MSNEVFNEGPTTSQHVESLDDTHFQNTTFKLKRTRSMGLLLDNGIVPFSNSPSLEPVSSPPDNNNNNNLLSSNHSLSSNPNNNTYSSTNSNSNNHPNPHSQSISSSNSTTIIPKGGRIPNSKLADGSFIPKEALNKLNLKTPKTTSSSNNLFRTNIINKKSSSSTPQSENVLSYDNSRYYNRSHQRISNPTPQPQHNESLLNSPQSIQSGDYSYSDDLYNSEDSLSSTSPNSSVHNSSICLIPKHQLKKMNQLANVNNNTNISTNDSINPNFENISSEHDQHQDLTNLLHDDIDVKDSPEQHVDYLTHKWAEEEISKSWKYVTLRRGVVADSARLENASWRTWAQTRLNLKTISPEELNWSKDTDVTWLYGPVIKPSVPNLEQENRSNSLTDSLNDLNNSNDILMTNHQDNSSSNTDNNRNNDNDNNNNNNNNNNIQSNTIILPPNHLNRHPLSSHNSNDDSFPTVSQHDSDNGENLKSILKKKSNVEKMISDASYSRLQHLLENREKFTSFSSVSSDPSTPTSIHNVPSDSTITNDNFNQYINSNNDGRYPYGLDDLQLSPQSNQHSITNQQQQLQQIQQPQVVGKSTLHRPHHHHHHHHSRSPKSNPSSSSSSSSVSNSGSLTTLNSSKSIKSSLKTSSVNINQRKSPAISTMSTVPTIKSPPLPPKKRIHFNMRVDQCIAIRDNNKFDENDNYIDSSDESDHYPVSKMVSSTYREDNDHPTDSEMSISCSSDSDSDMDSDSDDEGFVINTIHQNQQISNSEPRLINHQPIHHTNSYTSSNSTPEEIKTIAPLPSTTIKFGPDDELEFEQLKRSKYTVSHNTRTNRGYDYHYDYNTVYSDTSNPMIYNPTKDVQMFDVPENCQIDSDSPSITPSPVVQPVVSAVQHQQSQSSPFTIASRGIVNPNSGNVSPLVLPSVDSELVDVPESFMYDIPSFAPVASTPSAQHSFTPSNVSTSDDELEIGTLKRTSSIGSRNPSTQSLSSIKVGLSGLDLTASGLKRSTGAGSKPQLFQLAAGNTPIYPKFSAPPATTKPNKFMFENSDSDSSDSEDEGITTRRGIDRDGDSEMIDDDDDDSIKKSSLVNAVKSSASFSSINSLSDINRQFGSLSSQKLSTLSGSLKPAVTSKPSAFSFGDESSDSESD